MDRENDIDVLNDLVEMTIDSADGYAEAGKQTKDLYLKRLFEDRSAKRRSMVGELQAEIRRLGGDPERSGSTAASLHRTFLDLKLLVQDNRKTVIEEVERGEDRIRDKFREALSRGLSPQVETLVRDHLASITADHDQVSAMKHAAE